MHAWLFQGRGGRNGRMIDKEEACTPHSGTWALLGWFDAHVVRIHVLQSIHPSIALGPQQ